MSKSPNFFIPAIGGTALALGLAFGVSSRDYGSDKIELLESRVAQVEAQASAASQTAATEIERAAELERKIADVQAAAVASELNGARDMTQPAPSIEGTYGLGRQALTEEIAAWDVDVLPDGRGLPEGTGNAYDGEEIFAQKCAACHGDFAEGVDNWPVLAGGFDTLADKDPVKTVGSYWEHLSTAWDYINRSMPFGEAGTLTPDETYAIVAYILYSNDLIEDDFELTHENLGEFKMYNKDGFVIDDRPEREYATWRAEPCMENCKDEVEITMRSVFLVETPPEGGSESTMNPATIEGLPTFSAAGPSFIPAAATMPAVNETATPEVEPVEEADASGALIMEGEKVFRKCKACHAIGDGAKNKSGPQLTGLIGRTMGGSEGFNYSNVFQEAQSEGRTWDEASLAEFLANPKTYMKGTKMAFSGLRQEADVQAIIAYISTFAK